MNRFNLRKRQRINYKESYEPNLDEYIYCDSCGDYVYEYCSIHGPLLVIPDDKVPTKSEFPSFVPHAALTIPHVFLHLASSTIPGAGLGVFATRTLPPGVRFGPYVGNIAKEASSCYCWQIYDAKNRCSHVVDAADAMKSNWMRYVNCARCFAEQNVLAFQYQGQLYYRTIKIIPRFTELMVFYGNEYANCLKIDLKLYNSSVKYYEQDTLYVESNTPSSEYLLDESVKNRGLEDNPNEVDSYSENFTKLAKDVNACKPTGTILVCNECYKQCDSKKNMIEHLKTHTEFICNLCKFSTKKLDIFTKHLYARHGKANSDLSQCDGDKKHICLFCKKEFTRSSKLKVHLLSHTGEYRSQYPKENTCATCNTPFRSRRHLMSHMRTTHAPRNIPCSLCTMAFKTNFSLKRHLEAHESENIIICPFCPKGFKNRNNFELHLVHLHCDENNN